jgi:NCS2 family nucleobase:cation symporter-2
MAPSVSSAAVGLSIATGTLARRIALAGAAVLVVLALCPKLTVLFVLVPDPVEAAMLLYVAGFMMAQGCGMVAARMLDARRTVVVGLGLCSGLAVLVEPRFFAAALPALAAPLSVGALVAFLANLLTLPLVARRAAFTLVLGDGQAERLERHWDRLGGAWGLRRETAERVRHALLELCELLAARGPGEVTVAARVQEDRLEVTLSHAGAPLPAPAPAAPRAAALLEEQDGGSEALGVWLATRHAAGFAQRSTAAGAELRLEFEA